ncbi:MAG: SAF domain-containing protein [Acidimicrobiia bacterium]
MVNAAGKVLRPPKGDGPVREHFRLEPPPRQGVRVPQLVLGVLLVAFFALMAVLVVGAASKREPVLALASPIGRGEPLTSAHLRVAYLAVDQDVARLSESEASSLLGLVAVTDLREGTILTADHFARRVPLSSGEGVVGLYLAPGEYPVGVLAAGDLVDAVLVPERGQSLEAASSEVLVKRAEVFDVAELAGQSQLFVSLRMGEAEAARLAAAAAAGRVRLVLVGG